MNYVTYPRGWFAALEEPDTDKPDDKRLWQANLQVDGACLPLPIWFDTEAQCIQFIKDEVAGMELIDEVTEIPSPATEPRGRHD